jgi:PPK2 family polyphosphate:nucleotide phosphotransferase
MDASGKDSTIKRVFTGLNPQGCRVVSFKAPAGTEIDHDYLWRVHAEMPRRGEIGIFNRSHYEDVVTARILGVIDDDARDRRYRHVREFERLLSDEGTTLVKVFLHIGREEQRARLQRRLDDPEKRWKFRLDDLDTRARWDEYMASYDAAISETSTKRAPWYVVPADHKWISGLLVGELLLETLEQMDPRIPPAPDLDGVVVE